jgi:hypothetical protein
MDQGGHFNNPSYAYVWYLRRRAQNELQFLEMEPDNYWLTFRTRMICESAFSKSDNVARDEHKD